MAKVIKQEESTAVISMDDELKTQIANQQKMLGKISTKASFISFKGGQISIDGKIVPGAKTDVVLLAFMGERTYFEGAFDPDAKQLPLCYSYFDLGEADAVPHKAATEPQSKTCDGCPHNAWGSANVGKGKACRESIRVALVPAVKDLAKAQVWHARIPITSVPAFKSYVGDILSAGKPVWSVISELSVTPDAKCFFKVNWDMKRSITQPESAVLLPKAQSAGRDIAFEYPKPDAEEKQPVKQLKKGARK
jgi:hypothetical protein